MQPDRIQIEARARGPWEAIDLGFRMARIWWLPLYSTWLALVVPVLAGLVWLFWSQPIWALIAVWWLKPVFERVPLHVLSEALFGNAPGVRATLRAAPRWLRGGTLLSLTWLRFTPSRSMLLPILQLEGLRGARRAQRARLVVGPQTNPAFWLLWTCVAFQLFPLCVGGLGLAAIALPKEMGIAEALELAVSLDQAVQLRFLAVGYALSLTAVEPLYVAGGFALYINRRIFLEGWDIDLVFRKLARRAAAAAPTAARAVARGSVLAVLAALLPSAALLPAAAPAHAQDVREPCRVERPRDAGDCIDEILADPEFGGTRRVERWGLRDWDGSLFDWEPEPAEETRADAPWFLGILSALGTIVRLALLAAVALGLVALALYAVRVYAARTGSGLAQAARASGPEAPRVSPHLRPGELPSDVLAEARARFATGDATAALSLLYRAALACLDGRGVPLPASATEYECLREVRAGAPPALAADFADVVRAWALCAYGRRPPDVPTFESLCDRWALHLGDAAG